MANVKYICMDENGKKYTKEDIFKQFESDAQDGYEEYMKTGKIFDVLGCISFSAGVFDMESQFNNYKGLTKQFYTELKEVIRNNFNYLDEQEQQIIINAVLL